MENFLKALEQPEYVHVVLNHFPLTGLLVAFLFLLVALIVNQRPAILLALAMTALLSLSAWPVFEYGEKAYDRVLAMSDEPGGDYLKHHMELAERWIFLFYVTSAAAIGVAILGWKKPKALRPAAAVVALLAAGSLVAGLVIAEYGGQVRHREFRLGPPPAHHHESDEEHEE